MNSLDLSKSLDDLCHAEQRSMLPRLAESTVFVSWASNDEADALREMIQQEREHVAWLVGMIDDLGESPTPCTADPRTTSMHYVELDYLIPGVIQSKENLIRTYEHQAPDLAPDPAAANLLSKIIERHQAHLSKLKALSGQLESTSTDT